MGKLSDGLKAWRNAMSTDSGSSITKQNKVDEKIRKAFEEIGRALAEDYSSWDSDDWKAWKDLQEI